MLININNVMGVCHARARDAPVCDVSEGMRVLPNIQTPYSTDMEETLSNNDPRSQEIQEIRQSVRALCAKYGEDYWLELDRTTGYPTEFVKELTESGFLTVLIPEEYGGAGLGVFEAAVVMEEVCRSPSTRGPPC